jgi:hypothetical protein
MKKKLTDGLSNRKEATNVKITARTLNVSRAPGAPVDEIGSGQMGLVEFLPETNRAMGYITASRSVDEGAIQVTVITAISLVKVSGRVLLLNTVSAYRDRADLELAAPAGLAWTKRGDCGQPVVPRGPSTWD